MKGSTRSTGNKNPYESININTLLSNIFKCYDLDHSGSIDSSEFINLIKDLFEIRDGVVPRNFVKIAGHIAGLFDLQDGTLQRNSIDLEDFMAAARSVPSPFDDLITGTHGLTETLLQKGPILIELNSHRQPKKKSSAFIPTYEFQVIHPWHEPLTWSGLEINLSHKTARIPNPIQVQFHIPSQDNDTVRFYAYKSDTVADLSKKVSLNWPGLRVKQEPHNPAYITLKHKSRILTLSETVESLSLYFIHKEITIELNPKDETKEPESLPPPPPTTSPFKETQQNTTPNPYDHILHAANERNEALIQSILDMVKRCDDLMLTELDMLLNNNAEGEANRNDVVTTLRQLRGKYKNIKKVLFEE